nr:MAG TPA: hypothetical protein [Caudoviricetes sp.]
MLRAYIRIRALNYEFTSNSGYTSSQNLIQRIDSMSFFC